MKFNFIKPTLIFTIVGFFIPGFTAIGLLGLQMLLSKIGIECSTAWTIIWATTTIGGLLLPFLFYRHITTLTADKMQSLKTRLTFFNLFEYIFIQSSLTPLFTSGRTLCYVTDGQNGLELVFTAWLALLILIAFSFAFNQIFKQTKFETTK
jgi:hypothetical protein